MNSASVNLHSYYSSYVFLHNFTWFDMDKFWVWLAKYRLFFYYTSTSRSA